MQAPRTGDVAGRILDRAPEKLTENPGSLGSGLFACLDAFACHVRAAQEAVGLVAGLHDVAVVGQAIQESRPGA